jgi:hypothetical protein
MLTRIHSNRVPFDQCFDSLCTMDVDSLGKYSVWGDTLHSSFMQIDV